MSTLTTNIIRNVYNMGTGTGACDAGTQYCTDGYSLYFPCLKDITKGQGVCFDFYVADNTTHKPIDLRRVDAISLNLNGQYNCNYGTFSYPDNISSLQTEKYPIVYRNDFGERKPCHLSLFMIDIENNDESETYNTQEGDFYSGTEVELGAFDTPTHIFLGWALMNMDEDDDCPGESWYDQIISTSNIYKFTIKEDTIILALYRPRRKYNVISDPTNKSSHFNVDYDHIVYHISNRDEEIFNDDYDVLEGVLEGYSMVVKCIPSTDVIGDGVDFTYDFVEWKDKNTSRCRLLKIGSDTLPFEDGNIIKLKARCDGPVPYHNIEDVDIFYNDEFDEEGIHILTEPSEVDIFDFYGDGAHIKEAEEVYQKFIDETGYLYFHFGTLVLSSEGIEDGIKIILHAKADDYCEFNITVNGYTMNQVISTDEFKQYEFYYNKCEKSDITITVYGECLIDMIEVCREEIIDKGKAQFCLDPETTLNLPSGKLSVDGAISVDGSYYGLPSTEIGQVNRLPKIIIKTDPIYE